MAQFDGSANASNARSFVHAFHAMAAAVPEREALRSHDGSLSLSWGEVRARA